MPSRPNLSDFRGLNEFLALEACTAASCLLAFEDTADQLLLEVYSTPDLGGLTPTTRPNPSDPMPSDGSVSDNLVTTRPNSSNPLALPPTSGPVDLTTRPDPDNPLPMPSRPNAELITTTDVVIVRGQRSVTVSPIELLLTDEILNVNISTGSPSCTLPPVNSRNGAPLTFKDVGGHCFTNNLTLTGNSGELIDGLPTYVMTNNWAAVTVNPFNDGVNNGWFVT